MTVTYYLLINELVILLYVGYGAV